MYRVISSLTPMHSPRETRIIAHNLYDCAHSNNLLSNQRLGVNKTWHVKVR